MRRIIPVLVLGTALIGGAGSATPGTRAGDAAGPAGDAPAAAEATPAQRAFRRILDLEGRWTARSTKGWSGVVTFRVLARGTSVLQLSEIEPHEGEVMATLYHLDGDRLMLTHYCSAGNQPRLVAGEIADDGSRAVFSFLDGTNLRSRDEGHMDRAVFEWPGGDRYSSQWTWYADGDERWLERIEYARTF